MCFVGIGLCYLLCVCAFVILFVCWLVICYLDYVVVFCRWLFECDCVNSVVFFFLLCDLTFLLYICYVLLCFCLRVWFWFCLC